MKEQCNRVRDKLYRFLDGDLPDEESKEVEEHLKICPGCLNELERGQELDARIKDLPQLQCPDRVVRGIEETTLSSEQESRLLERLRGWFEATRWKPAAAIAVVTAVIVAAVLYPTGQTDDPSRGTYSADEIEKARKQATWTLTYVAQTIEGAKENAVEDLVRRELPRLIRGRLREATRTDNGGES